MSRILHSHRLFARVTLRDSRATQRARAPRRPLNRWCDQAPSLKLVRSVPPQPRECQNLHAESQSSREMTPFSSMSVMSALLLRASRSHHRARRRISSASSSLSLALRVRCLLSRVGPHPKEPWAYSGKDCKCLDPD